MTQPWNHFYNKSNLKITWPIFEKETDEFLHSIGSISHHWNFLEDTFYTFLKFSKIPNGVATHLGFKLNNNDKIEIMKILSLEFESSNPNASDRAKIFFDYASICAQNRNFIMHSSLKKICDSKYIIQKKSKKIGQYNTIKISIHDLRQMSQDMCNLAQFGARLQACMLSYPSGFSKTTNGKLVQWILLDPPPKPKSFQAFLKN